MILNVKQFKDAVKLCSPGIAAGVGLSYAGKVLFIPGYVMGCGTSINVKVPVEGVDDSFALDKASVDKIMAKANAETITIKRDSGKVKVVLGGSRITLPCEDLPSNVPEFPELGWGKAPEDFTTLLKGVSFENKSDYAGVAWDKAISNTIISTDSVRIVSAQCENLPEKAWVPAAAISALCLPGECVGCISDIPYLHLKYADGTICSVLYRAAEDFPLPTLQGYLDSFESGETVAEGELNEQCLEIIHGSEAFADVFDSQMPVRLTFAPGKIEVSSSNVNGEFCGEAEWDGTYTGTFTVDAKPFHLMKGSVATVIRKTSAGIMLMLSCANGVRIMLSPDA